MASKKRPAKKNSGPGNPAKQASRGRSVHALKIEQQIIELREDYARWIASQASDLTPQDAVQAAALQLEVVSSVAEEYAQTVGNAELFNLDPEQFEIALADVLVSLPEGIAPEPILLSWLDFLSYVQDQNLWTGEAETLDELQELLSDALSGFGEADAELCQVLRDTKLFAQVKAFAEAVGTEGIDIADFTSAADAPRAKVLEAMGIDPTTVDPDAPAPLVFKYVWNAAMMSVVDADGSRIVRDEESYKLLVEGDELDNAQVLFEMGVGAVQGHLNPSMDRSLRDEAHYLVLRNLLVTASTGKSVDEEGLRRNVGAKMYDEVLPEAQAAMASLADFGLLTVEDGQYSIDERLAPVISSGIAEVEDFFEEDE